MAMLMCRPAYFDIRYEINPWMSVDNNVDKALALQQWQALYDAIATLTQVQLVAPQLDVPDMVFTANAGFVMQKEVYLSHFRRPERQPERSYYKQWFVDHGYRIVDEEAQFMSQSDTQKRYCFEGAGDLLAAGEFLFAAHGFRTDENVYRNIRTWLPQFQLVSVKLVGPYFYHLDTCFCPLTEDLALLVPQAFSADSLAAIKSAIQTIDVCDADARHFATNAVVINDTVILPAGCHDTEAKLTAHGFTVRQVPMSEFIKSGGAAKCLTLRL
jgi:N-dimethylarginine dimethylaminohydrolase